MSWKDYYAELGVPDTAGADDIKGAYRKKAAKLHPDKNPGDPLAEERFKELGEAYSTLRDDGKRAAYDLERRARARARAAAPSGFRGGVPAEGAGDGWFGAGGSRTGGDGGGLWELLNRGTRHSRQQPRTEQGGREPLAVSIPIETAWSGGEIGAWADARRTCRGCHGTGVRPVRPCRVCGGSGAVRTGLLFHGGAWERICPRCHGVGSASGRAAPACPDCRGTGSTVQRVAGAVTVRPGTASGDQGVFREAGTGTVHPVLFAVLKSRRFERRGDDLIMQRTVTARRAGRGTTLTAAGIDGIKRRIKIPPGTADGTMLRLAGLGMPRTGGGCGDLMVQVRLR